MVMSDLTILADLLSEHFKNPFLLIYAYPHHIGEHGKKIQNYLISILKSSINKNYVEAVKFDGHHHFHMEEPEKTANIVLNFLNRDTFNPYPKM
jgi:hypothetical protein